MFQALTVFCGGSTRCDQSYVDKAFYIGELLALNGITVIYGGGNIGLMGALANGAISKNGQVIGVIPEHLQEVEIGHPHLTQLHIVKNMHERKQKMFDLSEGFIVLPGGFGTLDEIFEILTWKQIALHSKPITFFNHNGYWDGLKNMVNGMLKEKFIREKHLDFFEFTDHEDKILSSLEDSVKRYRLKFIGHTEVEMPK